MMPQLNLSKLSGQELRQRLDSSRARGDAKLAYEILREMSVRREAAGDRKKLARRRAEPHLVSVDLGDPLDHDDEDDVPAMPNWRPPELVMAAEAAAAAQPSPEILPEAPPEPEPPPVTRHHDDDEAPLTLHVPERAQPRRGRKAADLDLRLDRRAEAPPPRAQRPRRALPISVGFLMGAIGGLGLGWVVSGRVDPMTLLHTPSAAIAAAPAKLDVSVAAAEAPPAPAAAPLDVLPADTVPPEALAAAAPTPETVAAEAPVAELTAPPPQAAPGPAEVVKAVDTSATAADGCASRGTPADRAICEDPALQKLQTRLQQAYAEALDAHEDRATLRQRQLAWRDARNDVADPERLARLYEQRIRKLEAATAEARAAVH